jgi:hypothetical protein
MKWRRYSDEHIVWLAEWTDLAKCPVHRSATAACRPCIDGPSRFHRDTGRNGSSLGSRSSISSALEYPPWV